MKHEDIKELSNYLNFKEIPQFENAVTYGEHGETYFIILKGVGGVQVPNHAQIDNWPEARKNYLSLLEWKETEFDPKVEKAKLAAHEAFITAKMEKAVKKKYNGSRTHKNIQEMIQNDIAQRLHLKQKEKDARSSTFNFGAAFKEMDEANDGDEEDDQFVFNMYRDMDLEYMEKSDLKKLADYDELTWFVDVCQLQEGQSFGELALKD